MNIGHFLAGWELNLRRKIFERRSNGPGRRRNKRLTIDCEEKHCISIDLLSIDQIFFRASRE
jgi:hypothetical protein